MASNSTRVQARHLNPFVHAYSSCGLKYVVIKIRFEEFISSLMNREPSTLERKWRSVKKEVLKEMGLVGCPIANPLEPRWWSCSWRWRGLPLRTFFHVNDVLKASLFPSFDDEGLGVGRCLRTVPSGLRASPWGIALSNLCSMMGKGSLERVLWQLRGHFSCKRRIKEIKLGKQLWWK